MYIKISVKGSVTAEYVPVSGVVSITTINDGKFDESSKVAEVRFKDGKLDIYKHQNAWLVNDNGLILEYINKDYYWG